MIKQDMGFRRFLTRGKKNVLTEMFLLAIGYNLTKWHNKKMNSRNHSQLFEKMSA